MWEAAMPNNGTGFWLIIALIAAMSVAAIVEAAIGVAVKAIRRRLRTGDAIRI
jgi:hypothetical protein